MLLWCISLLTVACIPPSTGRDASFIFRGYESISIEQVIDFHVQQLNAKEAMVSDDWWWWITHTLFWKSECSRSVAVSSCVFLFFYTSLLYWNQMVSEWNRRIVGSRPAGCIANIPQTFTFKVLPATDRLGCNAVYFCMSSVASRRTVFISRVCE
jgi:hypothetical protein